MRLGQRGGLLLGLLDQQLGPIGPPVRRATMASSWGSASSSASSAVSATATLTVRKVRGERSSPAAPGVGVKPSRYSASASAVP